MLCFAVLAHPGAAGRTGNAYAQYWWHDAAEFTELAFNLLHGSGWQEFGRPTAWREPLPPLYDALWYGLLGERYISLLVGHGLLLFCGVLVTYRMAAGIGGQYAGTWAAALTVGNLFVLRIATTPESETLAYVLIVAALEATWRHVRDRTLSSLLQAGLWLALAIMSRATAIALLPVLLGVALYRPRRLARVLAVLLPLCLLTGAWGLRNRQHFGRFIPFSNRGEFVFMIDNSVSALREPFWTPYDCHYLPGAEGRAFSIGCPRQTDPAFEPWVENRSRQQMRQILQDHPGLYLRRCLRRLIAFYSPWLAKMSRAAQVGQTLKWLVMVLPGTYALWRWRREPWVWIGAAYVLVTTVELNLLIGLATQRYRVLIEPVFTVAAAQLYVARRRHDTPHAR